MQVTTEWADGLNPEFSALVPLAFFNIPSNGCLWSYDGANTFACNVGDCGLGGE